MSETTYKNFKLLMTDQGMPLATEWLVGDGDQAKMAWAQNQSRQRMTAALRHTENIHLRYIMAPAGYDTRKANDILEVFDNKMLLNMKALKAIYDRVIGISNHLGCKDVGRIFLSKLLAECEVARHTDEGDYFSKYGRYHLVLHTNPDAACEVDGEECFMPTGTVWWLENGLPHSFWNRGKTDRIHVIWDAL
jgi:hypothetical protein